MAMKEFLGLVSLVTSLVMLIPLGRILLKSLFEIVNPVPNPSKPPVGRGRLFFGVCLGSRHLLHVSHLYPWWRFPNSYL